MLILLRSYISPFLLTLLVLLLAFLYKWLLASQKPYKNPPPSPRKLPVIGNLQQLGLNPHRSLHALANKYGALMLLHFGSVPVIVVSSKEVAREIMKTNDLIFSNRPNATFPRKILYDHKDIAFAPYGEYWRQLKSIAVLHLLSNKRVQSYRQVREEETALLVEKIRDIACSPSSVPVVNLSDLLISLTNDVVCRVALGRKYGGRKFKELLKEFAYLMGFFIVGDYIPWLSWLNSVNGMNARVEKNAKEIDDFLEGVVEEHLGRSKRKGSGGESDEGETQDFVDILLQVQREKSVGFSFDKDTIKAVIMDMFVAGTDTVFSTLEWTMSELLKHPEVMKKLQKEVREISLQLRGSIITEDILEEFHYLKAVIKETMRLHAPIPLLVPREPTQDVKVMGYDIEVGTQVFINAWAIGRDPLVWEGAEEFKPERFMDSCIDYKGFHFELIPFGAGRRGCPGINFAARIIEIVLANIVDKFDLALPDGAKGEDLDMSETYGLTMHLKAPLMVVASTPP